MFLTLQQKRDILGKFGFEEYIISKGRYNYKLNSLVIAREFDRNGNGYVWGKELLGNGYIIDSRGWINVSKFNSEELELVIQRSMKQTKFKPKLR